MEQQEKKNYGLPPKETLILEEYREQHVVFEKLLRVVKRILRESIEENKIYINAIEGRVKAEDSLAGKLERKSGKYNSLSDLTDILGVRIITFYSDEVDKVAALVGRLLKSTGKTASMNVRCMKSIALATTRCITFAACPKKNTLIPNIRK